MNLSTFGSRLGIAVIAAIFAGVVALVFRAVGNEDPAAARTPTSFDAQPDLVEEQLPTSSPEPTEEATPEPAPRRRTGGSRAPAPKTEPQPAPSDLSPLSDLPAVPDQPNQPPQPETP
jgi:hypothetical protein